MSKKNQEKTGLGVGGPGWQHPKFAYSCLNVLHKVDSVKSFLLGTLGSAI